MLMIGLMTRSYNIYNVNHDKGGCYSTSAISLRCLSDTAQRFNLLVRVSIVAKPIVSHTYQKAMPWLVEIGRFVNHTARDVQRTL